MAAAEDARRDLIEKRRLERLLIKEIRAFDKRLVRQTVKEYAGGSGSFDAATLLPELTELLVEHYDRVGVPFSNQLTDVLPGDIEATDSERELIAAALASFFTTRSNEQAEIITNTNQRNINSSIDQAIVNFFYLWIVATFPRYGFI